MSLAQIWKTREGSQTPLHKELAWMDPMFPNVPCADGTVDAVSTTRLTKNMTSAQLAKAISGTYTTANPPRKSSDLHKMSTAQLVKLWRIYPNNFHVIMFMATKLDTQDMGKMYTAATGFFTWLGNEALKANHYRWFHVRVTLRGWIRILDYTGQAVMIYVHSKFGTREERDFRTLLETLGTSDPVYDAKDLNLSDPLSCPFRLDGTVPANVIGHLLYARRTIPFTDPKLFMYCVMGCLPVENFTTGTPRLLGGHLAKRHLAITLMTRMRGAGDEDFSDERLDREAIPICDCAVGECTCMAEPACQGAGLSEEPHAGMKRSRESDEEAEDEDLTEDEDAACGSGTTTTQPEDLNDFQKQQLENLTSIMDPRYERVLARMMPFNYHDHRTNGEGNKYVYLSDPVGGSPLGFLSMSPRAGKTRVFLSFAMRWLDANPDGYCIVGAVQSGSRDLWVQEASKLGMRDRVVAIQKETELKCPGKVYVMLHRKLPVIVSGLPQGAPLLTAIDESHCMSADLCTKLHDEHARRGGAIGDSGKPINYLVCISATPLGKTGSSSADDSIKLYARLVKLLNLKLVSGNRSDSVRYVHWLNTLIQSHATTLCTDMDGSCYLPPVCGDADINKRMVQCMLDLPKMVFKVSKLGVERANRDGSRQIITARIKKALRLASDRGELTPPLEAPVSISDIVGSMKVCRFDMHPSDRETIVKIEEQIQKLRDVASRLSGLGVNKLKTIHGLIERLSYKLFHASTSEQLRKVLQHAEIKAEWYSNMQITTTERSAMRNGCRIQYTKGDMPKEAFARILQKSQTYSEEDWACPVCQDEGNCITQCGHVYCLSCLQMWVDTNTNTCPTCRGQIRQVFEVTVGSEQNGRRVTVHCNNAEKLTEGRPAPTPRVRQEEHCSTQLTDCVIKQLRDMDIACPLSINHYRAVVFINSSMVNVLKKEVNERLVSWTPCTNLSAFNANPDKYNLLICSYFLATAVTIDAKRIIMASPPPDASAFRQAVCRTYMVADTETPTQLTVCALDQDRWWSTFKSRMSVLEETNAETGEICYSLSSVVAKRSVTRPKPPRKRRSRGYNYHSNFSYED